MLHAYDSSLPYGHHKDGEQGTGPGAQGRDLRSVWTRARLEWGLELTTAGPATLELEAEAGHGDGLLELEGHPLGAALGERYVIWNVDQLISRAGVARKNPHLVRVPASLLPAIVEKLLAELLGVPVEGGGDPAGVLAVAALQHRVAAHRQLWKITMSGLGLDQGQSRASKHSNMRRTGAVYFFLDTPTVLPLWPVVLVCWPLT